MTSNRQRRIWSYFELISGEVCFEGLLGNTGSSTEGLLETLPWRTPKSGDEVTIHSTLAYVGSLILLLDDVAWGETFDVLLGAEVGSFRDTYCSSKFPGYIPSDSGKNKWGDLVKQILSETGSGGFCVSAGPVRCFGDTHFVGSESAGGTLGTAIPKLSWNVTVFRVVPGVAAFGFLLELDPLVAPREFKVPKAFAAKMRPLDGVEALDQFTFAAPFSPVDEYQATHDLERSDCVGTN